MKSLKTKRNMVFFAGSIVIALIQLLCIYLTKMDAINIISFTIIQFMYMDFIKDIFGEKMKALAAENGEEKA
jgi:hypothetical protein